MPDNQTGQSATDQQQLPIEETDKETAIEQATERLAKKPQTIKDLLRTPDFKRAVADALPRAMRPERFVRVALTAMMRTPELMECSKTSLFRAMLDCSAMGLEPDGRRAHLIPFKVRKMCACGHEMDAHRGQNCSHCDCRQRRTLVECQLIIDYKGLAELVRRSGDVSYIHADVVYDKDEWSYAFGSEAHLKHKPNLEDRGTKRIAFYSYVRLKDGTEDFVVMGPAEVEKIRKRSKSPDEGPWKTDYDEMGKKTAFRRHSKWLPLSPEARKAIEHEDTEAVDVTATSTWDEMLEPGKAVEALPEAKRTSLKEAMMAQKGLPGESSEESKPEPVK